MVDFSGDAVGAELCVYGEGKVEYGRARRKCNKVAFRGEYVDFCGKKIEFYCVEKIYCVWFGVSKDVLYGVHPFVKLGVIFMNTCLVFPVCRIAEFRDFIHLAASYLHFDPFAVRSHRSEVKGTITVCLRGARPVTEAFRVHFVSVGKEGVYLPAMYSFESIVIVFEYYAHCINVVNLFKRNLLGLHLVVDGISAFYPCLYFVFESGGIEFFSYRSHEFLYNLFPVLLTFAYLGYYFRIFLRMLVFEGEVFEFILYFV